MFISRTVVVAGSVLIVAIGWFVAPAAIGRSLKGWEVLALAAASLGLLQWQRSRFLRRQREEQESMRDSALW